MQLWSGYLARDSVGIADKMPALLYNINYEVS